MKRNSIITIVVLILIAGLVFYSVNKHNNTITSDPPTTIPAELFTPAKINDNISHAAPSNTQITDYMQEFVVNGTTTTVPVYITVSVVPKGN